MRVVSGKPAASSSFWSPVDSTGVRKPDRRTLRSKVIAASTNTRAKLLGYAAQFLPGGCHVKPQRHA
jgi:hypothetical protein